MRLCLKEQSRRFRYWIIKALVLIFALTAMLQAVGEGGLALRGPAAHVEPPLEVHDPLPDRAHLRVRDVLPEDRLVRLRRLRERDGRHEGADPDRVDYRGLVEQVRDDLRLPRRAHAGVVGKAEPT